MQSSTNNMKWEKKQKKVTERGGISGKVGNKKGFLVILGSFKVVFIYRNQCSSN